MSSVSNSIGSHIPNRAVICIDKHTNTVYSGHIYYRNESVKVAFSDINALLRELEWYFDALEFPQSSVEYRTFGKKGAENPIEHGEMEENHTSDPKGQLATFQIHVQFRQNATWQGRLIWAEKDISQYFQSDLELLKLIDGALLQD